MPFWQLMQSTVKVEKYPEEYDHSHCFYKDNMRQTKCWTAVVTAIGNTDIDSNLLIIRGNLTLQEKESLLKMNK